MRRRARTLGLLLPLFLLPLTIGAAQGADAANSLTLRAVGTPGTVVTGSAQFGVGGDTPVRIAVARISSGNAKVVAGPDPTTSAIEFPPYVKSGTYPRAVVSVTPTSGNALSPGASDFEYGAVFRLNATSSGRSIDNGDNLWQRGLYEDPSQLKLQIDHGYPSCLIRGSAGQLFVSSSLKVTPDRWYRVTCSRTGTKATVQVSPYAGTAAPVTNTTTGSAGTLSFPASTPAAIGGKVSASGAAISSATDQFNGAVADVWINRVPVEPPPNQAPVAQAEATCTDLECTLSGAASTDPDSDPLTYVWDFGDGTDPGSGVSTPHTYATGATRTVTLTVSDDHGHSSVDTVEATTTDPVLPPDPPDPPDPDADQPPVAHATADCAGLDCTFSGIDSTDPEDDPLTYAWDFADDSEPGSGESTSHSYLTGAERIVTLTVSDDHGNSDTDTVVATTTDPVVDQPPVADATATCLLLSCTFSAAGSSDPENGPLVYAWDFGDGSTDSGVSTTHAYTTAATRTVTLTVTDDHDSSATDTVQATTLAPPVVAPISFVAAAATNGNRTSHTVTIPSSVRAGDALVLFFAANSTSPTYTNPTGWTVLQSRNGDGTVIRAFRKVATASDAGSTVRVTSSAYVKSDLTVAAYRSTSTSNPIAASASKVDNVTGAAHVSPAVTATGSTSWLVTYWADKSSSTSAWSTPAGQAVRAKTFGSSSGHISALLADSNAPVPAGPTGQKTATANATSTRGASVSLLLAPVS